MNASSRFAELRDAAGVDPAALDALWADLTPVTVPEILGSWRGGDFDTGHPAHVMLDRLRWHGKRFLSPEQAQPLVCRDAEGALYSERGAAGGGEASLWEVRFRGEVTATMVYDALPVFDHFKRVDGDTLMGIMNGKLEATFGVADHYYFWLLREQE